MAYEPPARRELTAPAPATLTDTLLLPSLPDNLLAALTAGKASPTMPSKLLREAAQAAATLAGVGLSPDGGGVSQEEAHAAAAFRKRIAGA